MVSLGGRTVAVAAHQAHPAWLTVESNEDGQVAVVAISWVSKVRPDDLAYTILLIKVQMHPIKVLAAIVLSLRLPGACSKFL